MKTKSQINFRYIPYKLAFKSGQANINIESCYTCNHFQCLAWADDPDADQSEYEQGNCHNIEIENSIELNCGNETICNLYEENDK